MKIITGLLTSMLIFFTASSFAQENVKGFGAVQCSQIIALLTDENDNTKAQAFLATTSWVQGHFTGRNLSVPEIQQRDLTGATPESLVEGIATLCLLYPDADLYQVAESLYDDLPYYSSAGV